MKSPCDVGIKSHQSHYYTVTTMDITRGELFIPHGKFDSSIMEALEVELKQHGHKRRNGLAIDMLYLKDEEVLINPIPDKWRDWMTPQLKARVLVSINPLQEYVMGVAGKELKESFLVDEFRGSPDKAYWIIEKFLRMDYDDFSYRILKHEIGLCHTLGSWNYCLEEKKLFESNWTGYPRNIVLSRMVKKIEGELIARREQLYG